MFVAVVLLYYCGLGALKYAKKLLGGGPGVQIPNSDGFAYFDEEMYPGKYTLLFVPRVYVQRYVTVTDVLKIRARTAPITKVVDFGCSEMNFFQFLKDVKEIEEVICIDIDEEVLDKHSCRVMPTTTDYLSKRETPLSVKVMKGSVSDFDVRLKDTNAVVAIELIEHLFPDTLEALPYSIFGVIQPETVILTTPNADFNPVIPLINKFRHLDHKFEWSRQQFEDWANNLTVRYPDYEVGFNGIGIGPEGMEEFGCCSQIAVFYRKPNARPKIDRASELKEVHKLIVSADFPMHIDLRTKEEIIQWDAENFIRSHYLDENYSVNDRIEVPFRDIMRYILKSCTSTQMLREVLLAAGWTVELVQGEEYAVILPYYGFDSDRSISDMSDRDNANYETWDDSRPEENWDLSSEHIPSDCPNDTNCRLVQDARLSVSENQLSEDNKQSGSFLNGHKNEGSCPSLDSLTQTFMETKETANLTTQESEITCSANNIDSSEPIVRRRSFECPNKNKNFRRSLCYDEPKSSSAYDIVSAKNLAVAFSSSEREDGSSEEIARLEDSCSQSKAGDSGYPNSSERDVDMDLTPEQVDEIVTESESSFEDGSNDEESVQGEEGERPIRPQQLQQIHWLDNMENGDVANNNRDWEGNNMEAAEAHIGDALQFEDVIDRRDDFALPLMDAVQHDFESDEDNKFVSACEFLNTSDETVVASEESLRHDETLFYDHNNEEEDGAVGGTADCSLFDLSRLETEQDDGRLSVEVEEEETQNGFPEWLLNIFISDVDAMEFAPGDIQEQIQDDGAGDVIAEVEEEQAEADANNEEPLVTVNGDLMGGGEPSSHN